jgi:hypothetical protein
MMNDQHEDIDFEVTDDGKLRKTEDEEVEFEEDLTFEE